MPVEKQTKTRRLKSDGLHKIGARSDCGIGQTSRQVGPFLQELFSNYNRLSFLSSDPLSVVHRYDDPQDQEVVAFIAALFSYGNAKMIIKAVTQVLAPMGRSPYKYILNYKGEALWSGFSYRFHKEGHLQCLFLALSTLLNKWGTLERIFLAQDGHEECTLDKKQGRVYEALNRGTARFRDQFSKLDDAWPQGQSKDLSRGLKFLINTPKEGGACKRLLMYFRWMVRKDELDLGLWKGLGTEELLIPLDTHVARISYYIGLRSAALDRAPNWAMVEEVTNGLRAVDPTDPIRFDFAISRLGILNLCKKKFVKSVCVQCTLQTACRYSASRVGI